jgi:hypothetical protein
MEKNIIWSKQNYLYEISSIPSPGRSNNPHTYSKLVVITYTKQADGVAQVADHLPTKNEALNSSPSAAKKKKKTREKNIYKIKNNKNEKRKICSHNERLTFFPFLIVLEVQCGMYKISYLNSPPPPFSFILPPPPFLE